MGKLLSGMRLTPQSSRQVAQPANDDLDPDRVFALGFPLSGLSRSDFVLWPEAADPDLMTERRYLARSGHADG